MTIYLDKLTSLVVLVACLFYAYCVQWTRRWSSMSLKIVIKFICIRQKKTGIHSVRTNVRPWSRPGYGPELRQCYPRSELSRREASDESLSRSPWREPWWTATPLCQPSHSLSRSQTGSPAGATCPISTHAEHAQKITRNWQKHWQIKLLCGCPVCLLYRMNNYHRRPWDNSVSVVASVLDSDSKTSRWIATSIVHSKLDYCNFLYYNFLKSQVHRLQQMHKSNLLDVLWFKQLLIFSY